MEDRSELTREQEEAEFLAMMQAMPADKRRELLRWAVENLPRMMALLDADRTYDREQAEATVRDWCRKRFPNVPESDYWEPEPIENEAVAE